MTTLPEGCIAPNLQSKGKEAKDPMLQWKYFNKIFHDFLVFCFAIVFFLVHKRKKNIGILHKIIVTFLVRKRKKKFRILHQVWHLHEDFSIFHIDLPTLLIHLL